MSHQTMPMTYSFEMTALDAIKVLRQSGRISLRESRELRRIVNLDRQVPESLYPLMELVFLVQTRPPTNSLH